jgi:phospholipid/cholesterol/gamma-HCH transport system ATP-binding protein
LSTSTLDIRRPIGSIVLNAMAHVGRLSLLVIELFRGLAEYRVWFPRFLDEAWNVGVGSLFIVLLVSGFAGGVMAFQTGYQFQVSLPKYIVGSLVTEGIVLELGAVLTALVLAGRIGARYAAELGTMRVTEQIDALESLGRSPASHLIVPRVLAGLLMIPTLTVFANVTGIVVGWYAVKLVLPVSNADFIRGARIFWHHQVVLLCRGDHPDSLLRRLQHQGRRRGGGQGHYPGRGQQLGGHPAARHRPGQDPAAPMIEVRDVHKRFGDQVVLNGANFSVEDGETVALLGPSGTGKSVLLKHIIGLIKPDSGTIIVDGKDVSHLSRHDLATLRTSIGYVFQNGALFDSMNVFENVRLGITNEEQFRDFEYAKERVAECLRLVNLQPFVSEKFPAELSGGMRKRVGISRAIAGRPKYLLYDEPTSGLDPVNADVIDSLVERLSDELGVTSVMVTHDVRGAFRVADRIALLTEGKIVAQGTPEEFRASSDPKVKAFLERDFDTSSFAA